MNLEKYFLPLSVFTGVLAVYLYFRGSQGNSASTVPNPASGGVPAPYSASGVVQPVSYNVPAMSVSPDPLVVLSQPQATNPDGTSNGIPPPYLTFNRGPKNNLFMKPADLPSNSDGSCGCGCGQPAQSCANQCNASNSFVDGSGNTPLSSSRARQIANGGDWMDNAMSNLNAYLALEGAAPAIPSLTSGARPGTLN